MVTRIRAVSRGRRESLSGIRPIRERLLSSVIRRSAFAAAALLGCALSGSEAAAVTKYVIDEPIGQHLQRTEDEGNLCSRQGMSMNSMVLFLPTSRNAVSVYWDRRSDRFLQYPGTTGCTVWKRIGSSG